MAGAGESTLSLRHTDAFDCGFDLNLWAEGHAGAVPEDLPTRLRAKLRDTGIAFPETGTPREVAAQLENAFAAKSGPHLYGWFTFGRFLARLLGDAADGRDPAKGFAELRRILRASHAPGALFGTLCDGAAALYRGVVTVAAAAQAVRAAVHPWAARYGKNLRRDERFDARAAKLLFYGAWALLGLGAALAVAFPMSGVTAALLLLPLCYFAVRTFVYEDRTAAFLLLGGVSAIAGYYFIFVAK